MGRYNAVPASILGGNQKARHDGSDLAFLKIRDSPKIIRTNMLNQYLGGLVNHFFESSIIGVPFDVS